METNLAGNSDKVKTGEKKLPKAVNGPVTTKKKSTVHRFTDIFLAGDVASVKNYIFTDVVIPTVKKALLDIIVDGANMFLYGETGTRSKRTSAISNVSYSSMFDNARHSQPRTTRHLQQSTYNYDDIILESKAEGEAVLEQLECALDQYKSVSVADLYESVGITARYTDNRYGWTNLASADVVRVRDGWMLKMPRAIDLK